MKARSKALRRSFFAAVLLTTLLVAILLPTTFPSAGAARRADCAQESLGLTPLIDMGTDTYQGFPGGLYPDGRNEIPVDHHELGLSLAAHVGPLDASGNPDRGGSIGFISIGVSNTNYDWEGFSTVVSNSSEVNPQVVLANGGVSGQPLAVWLDPASVPWGYLEDRIAEAGLSEAQVQVAWVMLPDRPPSRPPFSERQVVYRDQLKQVLNLLKTEFPNLTLAYISSLQWVGYGTENIVEPSSGYEMGFGVKWTIEDQIEGDPSINADPELGPLRSPWIAWGPYTWADGLNPRSDGLTWECSDYRVDGYHSSESGSLKVGGMLLDFLSSNETATGWFLGEGVEPATPITTAAVAPTTVVTSVTTTSSATSTTVPVTTRSPQTRPTIAAAPAPSSDVPWPWIVVGGIALLTLAGFWGRRR
ncbi:MAG TPA: hypothetical protein VJ796_09430 [Acidimicrobiia bacterium]|nr:hypothetical protein [Acidimicrobiia bacterium]